MQPLGELATDGGLAGSHQPDKIDIGATGHAGILTAERKRAGRAGPFPQSRNNVTARTMRHS
jgi:hypothetical protein